MDLSRLPEPLRRMMESEAALSPMEKVKALLGEHLEDALNLEEVEKSFKRNAARTTHYLEQQLAALDTVLAEQHPPGTLLRLVEYDANWGIDHDQTDRGAATFLHKVADLLRAVIEEAQGR